MIEDPINDLIDQAIDQLADDNAKIGAEALVDLAKQFAKAGLPQASFMNVRKFIIDQAIERTCPLFIQEKLLTAERALQEERNGRIQRIYTH